MLSSLFHLIAVNPLYNALVFLVSIMPFADLGLAVVILTVAVKLILFPFSLKAVKMQILVRAVEPKLTAIKEKYKNDRAKQAKLTMDLYKENNIKPFSSIFLIFIQLPIIFGLYWVFARGGLPELNYGLLYPFTPIPETFNMQFLWVPDISKSSIIFAILAGITQYFQIKLTLPALKKRDKNKAPSLKDDLARSFHMEMRYIMPLVVVVFAYIISSAIAIYWITSNLFAIGQELFVRRNIRSRYEEKITSSKTEEAAIS